MHAYIHTYNVCECRLLKERKLDLRNTTIKEIDEDLVKALEEANIVEIGNVYVCRISGCI